MPRRVMLVTLAVLCGCGEATTETLAPPDPIPWTPALEMAALSLGDPIVTDVVDALSDRATAAAVSGLILETRALLEGRRVRAAATRVTSTLEALRRGADTNDVVSADVLELVLGDVEERLKLALSVSPASP